ncbi:MAG: GspE/PulE family protein [bacterium]
MAVEEEKKLGELLLDENIITEEELEDALQAQKQVDQRLGDLLIERGLIGEEELVEFLSQKTGYPVVNLQNYPTSERALELVGEKQARRYGVLPLSVGDETLTIAMQDPYDLMAIDDIKRITELEVEPVIAPASEIEDCLENYYDNRSGDDDKIPIQIVSQGPSQGQDLTREGDEDRSTAVQIVNQVIRDALKRGASNVHIEPKANSVEVMFRVDGFVRHYNTLPVRLHEPILSRFEVMAETSSQTESEFGAYQNIRVQFGDEPVIIRLNSVETRFGDKLTIKMCRGQNYEMDLVDLGMDMSTFTVLEDLLNAPRGHIIFTGPEDSGKTTSLYASLRYLSDSPNSIVTVEDPIEYDLEFCTQLEVPVGKPDRKAAKIYDALRNDPDILMVSGIGEPEVARATLYAAASGCKVLSSYYADNALDCLYHLTSSEGVDNYQLANSTIGVIAQRLVRLLHEDYKELYDPTEEELNRLNLPPEGTYYQPDEDAGQRGYKGVTGIYQILPMTDHLKHCVLEERSFKEFQEAAEKTGITTLREKGAQKVNSGTTSVEEVLRVTFLEDFTRQLSLSSE